MWLYNNRIINATYLKPFDCVQVQLLVLYSNTWNHLRYLTEYKTHSYIRRITMSVWQSRKSTNIKRDEIDIINIINDSTFNLNNNLLNNENRYMKVTLESKQIVVARKLISADYHEILEVPVV